MQLSAALLLSLQWLCMITKNTNQKRQKVLLRGRYQSLKWINQQVNGTISMEKSGGGVVESVMANTDVVGPGGCGIVFA